MKGCCVSIITPAYNCKDTIIETYKSIVEQSFLSWEWIVVEDHSPDNSYAVLDKLAKEDDRIVLLRTKSNSGAAVARNIGIEAAKGRYIAFLDADDLWIKEKLEHQIAFMQDNNYAFSFTNYNLLYTNGKIKKHRIKKDIITYKSLLKSNSVGCLTAIYDSKQLGKVYMPLDCEKREDHGAWLDITRNGTVAHRLDEYLSIYRITGSSVSSKKASMLKYQYRVYRVHEKFGVIKSLWYVFLCVLNKIFKKY